MSDAFERLIRMGLMNRGSRSRFSAALAGDYGGLAASLSPRQIEMLRKMLNLDEELVFERGRGYVGLERISSSTLYGLLGVAAISLESGDVGDFERYRINETGRKILEAAARREREAFLSPRPRRRSRTRPASR